MKVETRTETQDKEDEWWLITDRRVKPGRLWEAVKRNDLEQAKSLLAEWSGHLYEFSEHAGTVLHEAAGWGHSEMVQWLIDQGLSVNALNADGQPVLFEAVRFSQETVVDILLNNGAQVNQCLKESGETALMWAVRSRDSQMIKHLCAAGAEIETEDKEGWRAIHWAAAFGCREPLLELVRLGAQTDSRTKRGGIREIAIREESEELFDLINALEEQAEFKKELPVQPGKNQKNPRI